MSLQPLKPLYLIINIFNFSSFPPFWHTFLFPIREKTQNHVFTQTASLKQENNFSWSFIYTFAWTDGLTRTNASSKWDLLTITGCPPLWKLFITVLKAQMDASLTKAARSAPLLKICHMHMKRWQHMYSLLHTYV